MSLYLFLNYLKESQLKLDNRLDQDFTMGEEIDIYEIFFEEITSANPNPKILAHLADIFAYLTNSDNNLEKPHIVRMAAYIINLNEDDKLKLIKNIPMYKTISEIFNGPDRLFTLIYILEKLEHNYLLKSRPIPRPRPRPRPSSSSSSSSSSGSSSSSSSSSGSSSSSNSSSGSGSSSSSSSSSGSSSSSCSSSGSSSSSCSSSGSSSSSSSDSESSSSSSLDFSFGSSSI